MEEEETELSFNIVRNYPTERKFILLKPISSSFRDTLNRIFGRR